MINLYVTFGQQYRHENHPKGGHPDGWFRFTGSKSAPVYRLIAKELGNKFCRVLDEKDFDKSFYPRGELKVFHAD